jgi:hypothetical protein
MLGYITKKNKTYPVVLCHKIKSFKKINKNLNDYVFIIDNNKILYSNNNKFYGLLYHICSYGHIQVLEWYKKSGYDFNYYSDIFDDVIDNNHIDVLKWFKKEKLKIFINEWSIDKILIQKRIEILKWLMSNYNNKKIIILMGTSEIDDEHNKNKTIKLVKFKKKCKYFKGYHKN